jgi:hypothetical protein
MSVSALWTGILGSGVLAWISLHYGMIDRVIKIFQWIWGRLSGRAAAGDYPAKLPRQTIKIARMPRLNALAWGEAAMAKKTAIQIMADLNVTNVSGGPIRILSARIRYRLGWSWRRRNHVTDVGVQDARSGYSGGYDIAPGATAKVRVANVFREKDRPTPNTVLVADVALMDQFNNEHWLRRQKFKHFEHILDD